MKATAEQQSPHLMLNLLLLLQRIATIISGHCVLFLSLTSTNCDISAPSKQYMLPGQHCIIITVTNAHTSQRQLNLMRVIEL